MGTEKEKSESSVRQGTEVIHLMNQDNFYSVMDRLSQRAASGDYHSRIILLWPARGKVLTTSLEFARLRAWCARTNTPVALVLPKKSTLVPMAAEQGLPVYTSLRDAADEVLPVPRAAAPQAERPERLQQLAEARQEAENIREFTLPSGVKLFLILMLLLLAAAGALLLLPRARVEITPLMTEHSVDLTLWTSDHVTELTLNGGIPTTLKTYDLDLEAIVPAGGSLQSAPVLATGEVLIRNTCDRTYNVDSGASLLTDEDEEKALRFTTLRALQLDPGEEQSVRVEAAQGGSAGNLPAGSIRYAAYPLSACWEVRQEKPTSGGEDGIHRTPTEADYTAAQREITEQISAAIDARLRQESDYDDLLTLGQPEVKIQSEKKFPAFGYAADTLTLRQTLKVQVRTVSRKNMETLVRSRIRGFNTDFAGLTGFEILSGPKDENGLSVWSVRADYKRSDPGTNAEALQTLLRGKSSTAAEQILASLENVRETRLTLLPAKLPFLPLLNSSIEVLIYPAEEVLP